MLNFPVQNAGNKFFDATNVEVSQLNINAIIANIKGHNGNVSSSIQNNA